MPNEPAGAAPARSCAICRRRAPLVQLLALSAHGGLWHLVRIGGRAVSVAIAQPVLASARESSDNAAPCGDSAMSGGAVGSVSSAQNHPFNSVVEGQAGPARLGKRQYVCPSGRCLANWARRLGQAASAAEAVVQTGLKLIADIAALRRAGLRRRRCEAAGDELLVSLQAVQDQLLANWSGRTGSLSAQEQRSAARPRAHAADRRRDPKGARE